MTTLVLVLLGVLTFSFLMQRPLKKQAEEQARLRDSLTEGTRVLLTSQLFGTITHVGEQQVIVEIAPGVEVTATKMAVARVVAPEDEEFEFADEDEALAAQAPDLVKDTGLVEDTGLVKNTGLAGDPGQFVGEQASTDQVLGDQAWAQRPATADASGAQPGSQAPAADPTRPGTPMDMRPEPGADAPQQNTH